MSFETGLVTYLEAQVPLVSNRIYPAPLPQGATLPAITYFRATPGAGGAEYSHSGSSNLIHPRYQIDVWGPSVAEVRDVAAQVVSALSGTSGAFGGKTAQASFMNSPGQDFYEADTKLYRRMLEFEIWHAENA